VPETTRRYTATDYQELAKKNDISYVEYSIKMYNILED
jgi:hypothetical protein